MHPVDHLSLVGSIPVIFTVVNPELGKTAWHSVLAVGVGFGAEHPCLGEEWQFQMVNYHWKNGPVVEWGRPKFHLDHLNPMMVRPQYDSEALQWRMGLG